MNFNLSLPAFRPQLSGIINLVDFAANAPKSPTIFFISSISSVLNHHTSPPSPVGEEIILDTKCPSPMGYGESKYIAERLLSHAATEMSLSVRIARVGQIAGPVKSSGQWNKWEWLPSLVLSSLHIGAVPESLGSGQDQLDWVPIDLLAEILVELTLNPPIEKEVSDTEIFHPLHPHPVTWTSLLPIILETLRQTGGGKAMETVPFASWLRRVRADVESTSGGPANHTDIEARLKLNPAVKLLEFYEALLEGGEKRAELDTSKAKAASGKLRDLEALRPEWMQRWIQGWLVAAE